MRFGGEKGAAETKGDRQRLSIITRRGEGVGVLAKGAGEQAEGKVARRKKSHQPPPSLRAMLTLHSTTPSLVRHQASKKG